MNRTQVPAKKIRRILILGSTGFIGRAVMSRLSELPDFAVQGASSSGLDLAEPDAWRRLAAMLDRQTILIHAARIRPGANPFDTMTKDIAISVSVARALTEQPVRQCLYLSTSAVYGDTVTNTHVTEATPVNPSSYYGIAKSTGEAILSRAAGAHKIPLAILRACMIYGPGDTPAAYGPARFIDSLRRKGRVTLFGDGTESRDYVFIDDLAKIMEIFASQNHAGVYNVATGKSYSFVELVRILEKVSGKKVEMLSTERDRPKASMQMIPGRLFAACPDFQFTPLEEGLKTTYSEKNS